MTRRAVALLGAILSLVLSHAGHAAPPSPDLHYRIDARIDVASHDIVGTALIRWRNSTGVPVTRLPLILFPNRFASPSADGAVDDSNRPFVYPYQDFDPGSLALTSVALAPGSRAGAQLRLDEAPPEARGGALPSNCVAVVVLDPPLPPGVEVSLSLAFTTRLPNRLGAFGWFEDQITAIGGWYPQLAAMSEAGRWDLTAPPARAAFEVRFTTTAPVEIAVNGAISDGPVTAFHAEVATAHLASLVTAESFARSRLISPGGRPVTVLARPMRRHHRIGFGPSRGEVRDEALLEAADAAGEPSSPLVVVEAPLRLHLDAPGQGMVVLSDRAFAVHPTLQPFHRVHVTAAVLREALFRRRAAADAPADEWWINEGLSLELARPVVARHEENRRSVRDWIELFNVFAIVDRFETAPKVPFLATFFPNVSRDDVLGEQPWNFARAWPPGHVIFDKLRAQLGDASLAKVVDDCAFSPSPFRQCLGADAAGTLDPWLAPYPALNYRFTAVALNQEEGGQRRHEVEIERTGSAAVEEPVTVELQPWFGPSTSTRWDGRGNAGRVSVTTPGRVARAVIDPEHELIETTRADNASPSIPQIVLDTAEVEVSSTEFSVAGTVVARSRYDYSKDLAVVGFYTNRGVGMTAGARSHFGARNDHNSYRHNVYAFYTAMALDGDFTDDRRPSFSTDGRVQGFGLRYDFNDIYSYDNPTRSTHVRLFADLYARSVGSSYDYANWGGSVAATQPLWSYRTVAAGEVFGGFTKALDDSAVPNQGRFSLGGAASIRGIGAEEELGRNLFLIRGELRQAIYPEVDLNLMDLFILRRGQAHIFVDAGDVDDSAGRVFDPRRFAVGFGVGLGTVYEFMGLYPATMYLEIATRLDDGAGQGTLQVLFGTRQAF